MTKEEKARILESQLKQTEEDRKALQKAIDELKK